MDDQTPLCHRCQGTMTPGMLTETDFTIANQVRWVSGPPRAGWGGALEGEASGKREKYRVVTYRCDRCGALESFAREQV